MNFYQELAIKYYVSMWLFYYITVFKLLFLAISLGKFSLIQTNLIRVPK